jgi:hypothetical protein
LFDEIVTAERQDRKREKICQWKIPEEAPLRTWAEDVPTIPVYGYIFDVKSGNINEVEGTKALGAVGK